MVSRIRTVLAVALALALSSTAVPAAAVSAAELREVAGYVDVGAAGQRAAGGEVRVTLIDQWNGNLETGVVTLTDASGHYSFTGVTPSQHYLVFDYLGTEPLVERSDPVEVTSGQQTDHLVGPGFLIAGHIDLDEVGRPGVGVVARLSATRWAVADANGDYSFGRVPSIDRFLRFDVRGYNDQLYTFAWTGFGQPVTAGTGITVRPTSDRDDYDVFVGSGPGLTGVVADENEVPLEGVEVVFSATDGGADFPPITTVTDAEGRYRLFGLPPTDYVLDFRPPHPEDGRPVYSASRAPDDPWWADRAFGSGSASGLYPTSLGTTHLTAYSGIWMDVDGPGAQPVHNSAYGTLVADLWWWDDAVSDWTFAMELADFVTDPEFTDLLPGDYAVQIYREGNPAFSVLEAYATVEAGRMYSYGLWLTGPMSPQLVTFADVPPDHQFATEIEWLYQAGITRGTVEADGTRNYHPAQAVSRAAMAAFLYRAAGEPAFTPPANPSFADVPTDFPFYLEIEWMKSVGITTGTHVGTALLYQPYADVIRRDMAAFLYRAAGSPTFATPTTPPFTDTALTSQFVREIAWLKSTGISTGNPDGSYSPGAPVHRAAMAAFLFRMFGG